MTRLLAATLIALLLAVAGAAAQQVRLGPASIAQTVSRLKPGEYVWEPEIAPKGPALLIVNLETQRAVLYRNGLPIGASTVSTGRPGYETPTGVFTILQKRVEHYSSKYDNAPMPYMQRLTWYGIALHAGQLPGYPASHGCIRMPLGFARLLYGATSVGMTVIITRQAATPHLAPDIEVARPLARGGAAQPTFEWHPDRSPSGPLSIVVSAADRRAIILRNGVEIGSGEVIVEGPVAGTTAYALRSVEGDRRTWFRVQLSGKDPAGAAVPAAEWRRFRAPEAFRKAVAAAIEPGTTIVVTSDSLRGGSAGSPVAVLEDEGESD